MPRVRRTYWLFPELESRRAQRQQRPVDITSEPRYGSRSRNSLRDTQRERSFIVSKDQANLVSSNVPDKPGIHAPVLDLDIPFRKVESTQSSKHGGGHLYIDVECEEDAYFRLLDALADCNIIERGYANASKNKGGTFVRPKGVYKSWIKRDAQGNIIEPEPVAEVVQERQPEGRASDSSFMMNRELEQRDADPLVSAPDSQPTMGQERQPWLEFAEVESQILNLSPRIIPTLTGTESGETPSSMEPVDPTQNSERLPADEATPSRAAVEDDDLAVAIREGRDNTGARDIGERSASFARNVERALRRHCIERGESTLAAVTRAEACGYNVLEPLWYLDVLDGNSVDVLYIFFDGPAPTRIRRGLRVRDAYSGPVRLPRGSRPGGYTAPAGQRRPTAPF